MGFLSDLLARPTASTATLEDAEARVKRAADERARAEAEIDRLRVERKAQLLVSDDATILKLDAAIAGAELTLERLDEIEPGLLVALTEARGRKRRLEWESLRGRYFAASRKFLASARGALADLEALRGVIDEGQARFGPEFQATFSFPSHVLASDLLALFDRAVERAESAAAPKRPQTIPAPRPVGPQPTPASKGAGLAQIAKAHVEPKTASAPTPPKPKTQLPPPSAAKPFTPTPDANGMVRIVALKGMNLADGRTLRLNDVVALPEAEAFGLVRSLGAEFADAVEAR